MSNKIKIKSEDINPNRQLSCRYVGCFQKIKVDKLMCLQHWQLVPKEMQNRIYSAFSKFKSIIKVPHASTDDIQAAITNLNIVQNEAIDFVSRPGIRTNSNLSEKDSSMIEQAKVYLNNKETGTVTLERIIFYDSQLPPPTKTQEILDLERSLINLENEKLPEGFTLEIVADELNKKMPPTMLIKAEQWCGRGVLRAYIKDLTTVEKEEGKDVLSAIDVPPPVEVKTPTLIQEDNPPTTSKKASIVDESGLPTFPLTVKKLDSMKLLDDKDDKDQFTEIYRG